ncbi:MAG: hypothetical protein L6V93_09435 [Clostridiales bacterium]|nr:MAG: hypothetical protein L6V93_09435 [Clostridiales bacterium]
MIVDNDEIAVTTTKDMALGALMLMLITIRIYNARERNFWKIYGLPSALYAFLCALRQKRL